MLQSGKLKRNWYVIVSIIAAAGLFAGVYAFNVTWSAPVSIVATSPDIRVYWDSACTNPATSLNFGNVQQGGFVEFHLWIKNQGNGEVKVYWNSTLSFVTNQVLDDWNNYYYANGDYRGAGRNYFRNTSYPCDWNSTSVGTGGIIETYYQILLDASAPLSSYSWTLCVGAWTA
jgi:hypothetical protein